jgi:hypothetical protein
LENPVVWLSQLAQDFKKKSVIDQIKIQLLILALCLMAKGKKKEANQG